MKRCDSFFTDKSSEPIDSLYWSNSNTQKVFSIFIFQTIMLSAQEHFLYFSVSVEWQQWAFVQPNPGSKNRFIIEIQNSSEQTHSVRFKKNIRPAYQFQNTHSPPRGINFQQFLVSVLFYRECYLFRANATCQGAFVPAFVIRLIQDQRHHDEPLLA